MEYINYEGVTYKPNLPYYLHKVSSYLFMRKIPILPFVITQCIRYFLGAVVPAQTKVGKNVYFGYNGLGIVLHPEATIGDRVLISHQVTIGGRKGKGAPVIEDDVKIGAGAKVLGNIRIGKGSLIGANAVVIKDVKAGSTAVGVPSHK
jgi:serine O-acetyltransferase